MQSGLSFDNAPPLAAPLRFFLTAPLFLVLAGLLLVASGPDIFASRWLPATLALVHLLTIGFMLQVMIGALIQVLPVVAGVDLGRPLLLARLVHPLLTLGTLLLAAAFLVASPLFFRLAVGLLAAGIAMFLFAAVRGLWPQPSTSPTIRGLKLSLLALAVTVGLGLLLALGLAHGWNLPYVSLTDLHAGWGLGAWAGVLLAAMAYVVVPMFQLTPGYPARPSWWFPPLIIGLLLLWSAAVWIDSPLLVRACQAGLAATGMAFAGLTLRLQRQRRRARADATSRYWQGGLVSAIAALAMLTAAILWPPLADFAAWTPLFAVLLVVGAFVSFIAGMLYKIVPFLAWLHLQHGIQVGMPAPNMNRLLADADMQRQMRAHLLAVVLLAAAAFLPEWLARPAGAALSVAGGWLFWNLFQATLRYRSQSAAIDARGAAA
jgi:hypothetical protein